MSEAVVLDTHIWLWLINGNYDRFPAVWRDMFETIPKLGVCPVSCYEIALAHSRGRIQLSGTDQEWFAGALGSAGIELFPLTEQLASSAVALSPIHKDPFDRLIMATAIVYGAKLATVDGLVRRYPEVSELLLE